MANTNLQVSRSQKTDEFYTQLSTIEDELKHYKKYFKDKIVCCNADDPAGGEDGSDHFGDGQGGYTSNFFRYFKLNFKQLGLKKLIATHYDPQKPTYKLEISQDLNHDGKIDDLDIVKTPLKQNGDFRSPECLELLTQCDIVVTNPPFSLMKEYIPTLIKSDKKFLILGNINHLTLKELFGYLKNNQLWLGYNSGHFWFRVPSYYENKKTDFKIDETGQKWRRMGNICWFTNMDIEKRHEPLDLFKTYTPEANPHYDDYDAIEVSRNIEIPYDTDSLIGVPITFLSSHCKEQFEIIDLVTPKLNGKTKYKRLIIKKI